jgi:hypothetical protein
MIGRPNHVYCTCREWLKHGPEIVRQRQVDYVTLTDKNPPELNGIFLADAGIEPSDDGPLSLPSCLYAFLNDHPGWAMHYRNHQLAADAISAACLAWARSSRPYPGRLSGRVPRIDRELG